MSNNPPLMFPVFSRLLHWAMAVLLICMLFIGIGMTASLDNYSWLLSIHKSLGITLLILALLRLLNRLTVKTPDLPEDMTWWQKAAANSAHIFLYILMISMPLIGWGMSSAGHYPVVLYDIWTLPPLLSPNIEIYNILRSVHSLCAYMLFGMILMHISAALMHAFVFKDGVFQSMTFSKKK